MDVRSSNTLRIPPNYPVELLYASYQLGSVLLLYLPLTLSAPIFSVNVERN